MRPHLDLDVPTVDDLYDAHNVVKHQTHFLTTIYKRRRQKTVSHQDHKRDTQFVINMNRNQALVVSSGSATSLKMCIIFITFVSNNSDKDRHHIHFINIDLVCVRNETSARWFQSCGV